MLYVGVSVPVDVVAIAYSVCGQVPLVVGGGDALAFVSSHAKDRESYVLTCACTFVACLLVSGQFKVMISLFLHNPPVLALFKNLS